MDNSCGLPVRMPALIPEQELEKWQQWAQANPEDGRGHLLLGSWLHTLKQNTDAIKEYKIAIALLLPEEQRTGRIFLIDTGYYWLGIALQELGSIDEAKAQWAEVVRRHSDLPEAEAEKSAHFIRARKRLQD